MLRGRVGASLLPLVPYRIFNLINRHRFFENPREFFRTRRTRRELRDAMLWQRALDKRRDVRRQVAKLAQARGHAKIAHDLDNLVRENLTCVFQARPLHIGAENFRRLEVPLRARRRRESKNRRCVHNH